MALYSHVSMKCVFHITYACIYLKNAWRGNMRAVTGGSHVVLMCGLLRRHLEVIKLDLNTLNASQGGNLYMWHLKREWLVEINNFLKQKLKM